MGKSNKLNCQESVELVTDYLEKSLLPELELQFKAHLAGCPDCTIYLGQMQQGIQLLCRLTHETAPEIVKQALLDRFRDWQNSRQV